MTSSVSSSKQKRKSNLWPAQILPKNRKREHFTVRPSSQSAATRGREKTLRWTVRSWKLSSEIKETKMPPSPLPVNGFPKPLTAKWDQAKKPGLGRRKPNSLSQVTDCEVENPKGCTDPALELPTEFIQGLNFSANNCLKQQSSAWSLHDDPPYVSTTGVE
jgi:hypothetical protein